jgi:tyrosyl-tRNA synthetase
MRLSDDLVWRNLIKDRTFKELSWLDAPKTFYLGIDPSADSLTVGNLAVLLLARRLSEAGWDAVLVMGGGTTMVGDPGGKTEERKLKSREEIEKNIDGVRAQVTRLFAGKNYELVDNYDWLAPLKYVDFLREVGKHFSMTELMQRDFVVDRMGEGAAGISYAEFSYSLVQGYDFWHLYKNNNVIMQIGGSDQWGNMLSGVPLIKKKEGVEAHVFSMPLIINKATGRKFGKSEGGAVWLDADKTSPFKFYQFWINTTDEVVEDYLKVFTMLSKEEVDGIINEFKQNPSARVAQQKLAYEVTKIVHGQDQAAKQQRITEALFGGELEHLEEAEVATIREEFPNLTVPAGMPVLDILISTELAKSNSEARRLKESGAIYVNNQKFAKDHLEAGDFKNNRLLIRRGKAFKDSALIELQ